MGRHGTPSDDKAATNPGRYETEIQEYRRWMYWIQLVTRHVINDDIVETRLEDPPRRPTLWWARWTGRRMIARRHRDDVRMGQPWAV